MSCPLLPNTSVATEASLRLAVSKTFCRQLISCALLNDRFTGASECAQFADRLRGKEALVEQAMPEQVSYPLVLLDIRVG
jgi:hypothetical protein